MNYVEFASYTDDNTPFFMGNDLNDVILAKTEKCFNNTLQMD